MWIKLTPVSIHAPRVGRDPRSRGSLRPRKRFNSRAPRGARPPLASGCPPVVLFQFTRPAWGATQRHHVQPDQKRVSIHAPRVGRDNEFVPILERLCVSIHAPRVGRDGVGPKRDRARHVSIHAPRVGRDGGVKTIVSLVAVSIHAPRVGRDARCAGGGRAGSRFQFTRPAWGATGVVQSMTWRPGVSIHAPRVGRDLAGLVVAAGCGFQFTRPAWGATDAVVYVAQGVRVSIHAPRVGRDADSLADLEKVAVSIHAPRVGRDRRVVRGHARLLRFNSRAPRGARRARSRFGPTPGGFNSRAPRGARLVQAGLPDRCEVSIHAPRVGRDRSSLCLPAARMFQFTRPAWGATHLREAVSEAEGSFNSRAPRGARPVRVARTLTDAPRFNSRAPRGARLHSRTVVSLVSKFQFTRPAWGATSAQNAL